MPYEAQLVEVSGRCKEFRDHPERKDLQSLLLVNVKVRPVGKRRLVKLSHLWVLAKHVRRCGVEPKRGRRLSFIGSVYAYFRLGGKSKQRGLHGYHDFSILPMGAVALQTFKPGINARYENKEESSLGGTTIEEEGGSNRMGESKTPGSKHDHRGHRDNRSSKSGSRNRGRQSVDDQQPGETDSRKSRKPRSSNTDGRTEDPRDRQP